MGKVKTSIEKNNNGVTLPNTSKQQEETELDQLVESLKKPPSYSPNTNPATNPNIAPKGVYNTSETSKINIDDEIFESPTKKDNINQTALAIFSIFIVSLLAIGVLIARSK